MSLRWATRPTLPISPASISGNRLMGARLSIPTDLIEVKAIFDSRFMMLPDFIGLHEDVNGVLHDNGQKLTVVCYSDRLGVGVSRRCRIGPTGARAINA
jgi:hypothetical protein